MAARRGKALASTPQARVAEAEAEAIPAGTPATVAAAARPGVPASPVPVETPMEPPAVPAVTQAEQFAPAAVVADDATRVKAAPVRGLMEKSMNQVTKTTEGLFKAAEDVAEFSRGNLEAVAKATQVYVAGVQDLSKQTFAMVQGLADRTVAGARALSTVKSLKEAADIQATYARAALEKSFTETAKLQEAALKMAEASFAPLSARMTVAVEKFSKPLVA